MHSNVLVQKKTVCRTGRQATAVQSVLFGYCCNDTHVGVALVLGHKVVDTLVTTERTV